MVENVELQNSKDGCEKISLDLSGRKSKMRLNS